MEKEALVPKLTSLSRSRTPSLKECVGICLGTVAILGWIAFLILIAVVQYEHKKEEDNYVPNVTIPSMDFTVLNITTETSLTVKWDVLVRLPSDLPGRFMCLKGDFKFSILYKGLTIATSSIESYNLIPRWAQLIKVSSIASEDDMDSMTMKYMMADIKEIGEIRFRSRLVLPDCRYGTSGKMNYACDVAILRFEPGSRNNATLFGNLPICRYLR
ncbi:hypothetical protein CARUB_v10005716mg [Capsella rubella]|uniref:Late embryogenesis abundant protein LEA-2 subgroup domain-containing protein n=1 Tax=Capsella rubella TaxID=81985 RepID=R0GKN1_9BRAS|nr:uncharacterized protein LOC17878290 [Capsella rubella]XP_023635274.1 uncharacterized protein LOC17878290 [Capsella rubella]EOA17414.1 hypothetical protein CARUB_v10005716mg [Capsella rubella]